ncbi:class II aldolase/adducin family protein [Salmonella enterica subsp. enterica]|nr:class II aldolase/adducin family protein [Salmonella enterica subsp. enterica]
MDPQGDGSAAINRLKRCVFHLALYRNNPCCKAVVHLHSTVSGAFLSRRAGPAKCDSPVYPLCEVRCRMGDIPLVPYYRPGMTRYSRFGCAGGPASGLYWLIMGRSCAKRNLQEAANNTEGRWRRQQS